MSATPYTPSPELVDRYLAELDNYLDEADRRGASRRSHRDAIAIRLAAIAPAMVKEWIDWSWQVPCATCGHRRLAHDELEEGGGCIRSADGHLCECETFIEPAIAPALSREYAAHVAQRIKAPAWDCQICGGDGEAFPASCRACGGSYDAAHAAAHVAQQDPAPTWLIADGSASYGGRPADWSAEDEADLQEFLRLRASGAQARKAALEKRRRAPAAPVSTDTADAPRPAATPLRNRIVSALRDYLAMHSSRPDNRAAAEAMLDEYLVLAVAPPASQPDAIELAAYMLYQGRNVKHWPTGATANRLLEGWRTMNSTLRGRYNQAVREVAAALGSRGGATAAPAPDEPVPIQWPSCANCGHPWGLHTPTLDGTRCEHERHGQTTSGVIGLPTTKRCGCKGYEAASPPVREGAPE